MDIYLKQFSKRENSTKIATFATSDKYSCTLKDETDLLNPSILLNISSAPTSLNYAKIDNFNRYYFVRNWTCEANNLWRADLSVDVLASWKSQIGSQTQYIARADLDPTIYGYLSDSSYPTLIGDVSGSASVTFNVATFTNPFIANYTSGTYVIGILGNRSTDSGTGFVSYYGFSATNFRSLSNFLWGDQWWQSIAQVTLNPAQYVVSLKYLPFSYNNIAINEVRSSIQFGFYSTGTSNQFTYKPFDINGAFAFHNLFDFRTQPKHPQASTRGTYLNYAPYSEYHLIMPPFGEINIPSEYFGPNYWLAWEILIDQVTGDAEIKIGKNLTTDNKVTNVYYRDRAKLMVDLPINQASIIPIGNIFEGALTTGVSVGTGGNVAGAVVGGVFDGLESLSHINDRSDTRQASLIQYFQDPQIVAIRRTVTEPAFGHIGIPFLQNATISNFGASSTNRSGYIKTDSADINIPCTITELTQIKNYMDGGFFYE